MAKHARVREVTLRNRPRGGGPLPEARGTTSVLRGGPRLILLVHGYCVSEREAKDSFAMFERWLEAFAPHLAPNCARLFWPGDAYLPGVRLLMYPVRLKYAKKAAPMFARFLHDATGAGIRDIVLIGHSLGCRLILETLRRIHRLRTRHPAWAQVRLRFVLMAPAVPVTLVADGTKLRRAAEICELRGVLFSRDDQALGSAFAVGQFAGHDGLTLPIQAVGKYGLPGSPAWNVSRELLFHRHEHYWESREAARTISAWLGGTSRPEPGARPAVEIRPVAVVRPDAPDRIVAPPRRVE